MQQEMMVAENESRERDVASARERAYAFVRDGILGRRFTPGAFLEEEQVSSAIGVSRTPVREAFHRLAAEQWLQMVPRRGALVRQVTAQELVDVYEARRLIEGHAVRAICAARGGAPEASRVALTTMAADGMNTVEHQVRLDQQLHRGLVATLNNAVLIEMYDGLRAKQQLVALSAFGADPSRLRTILDEHRALLEALDAHDAPAAEAVLATHLQPLAQVIARL